MLMMSQEAKKSVLAYSQPTGGRKPYLRSTSIHCYLCLLLNSHFLTEAGIHVFILGCISAGLPKTEANWQDVISDLKRIEDLIQGLQNPVSHLETPAGMAEPARRQRSGAPLTTGPGKCLQHQWATQQGPVRAPGAPVYTC
nr:PREDICTED: interleukin-15 isoform X4 [Equus przewalskii]XP_014593326.1 interleukin-15 isoform X8 [Equus caballus]